MVRCSTPVNANKSQCMGSSRQRKFLTVLLVSYHNVRWRTGVSLPSLMHSAGNTPSDRINQPIHFLRWPWFYSPCGTFILTRVIPVWRISPWQASLVYRRTPASNLALWFKEYGSHINSSYPPSLRCIYLQTVRINLPLAGVPATEVEIEFRKTEKITIQDPKHAVEILENKHLWGNIFLPTAQDLRTVRKHARSGGVTWPQTRGSFRFFFRIPEYLPPTVSLAKEVYNMALLIRFSDWRICFVRFDKESTSNMTWQFIATREKMYCPTRSKSSTIILLSNYILNSFLKYCPFSWGRTSF